MAASAAPITHVHQMTRCVPMPLTSARSGLSAVARIALPILLRFSTRYTVATRKIATMAIKMASGGIRTSMGR